MSPPTGTRLFWAFPTLFLAAGLAFAFWPRAVEAFPLTSLALADARIVAVDSGS